MKVKTKFKQTEIGMIPEDWEVKELGNVCEIRRGASPRPIQNYISNSGIPWIKIADATSQNTRFIEWTNEFIKKEGEKSTVLVEPGDLILSNSATPGIPKIVKIHAGIHDGWLLISNFRGTIKDFMYYLFLFEREKLVNFASGTIFKNLKTEIVKNYKISLPPLPEQRAIAKILSDLDSKIELLQNMNKTFEAISQAIFKHWFVDFEFPNEEGKPYKSGSGEMVYNEELGKEIPKGWMVGKIGKELKVELGGTPDREKKEYRNGDINWINSGKINEFRIIEPSEKITEEGLKNSATKLLPKRTMVLAITGATLGKVSLLEIDSCANQSVVGIIPNEKLPTEFVYFWIKEIIKDIIGWQTGGAQQHINKRNVENSFILIPPFKIIKEYKKAVSSIFDKITILCFESLTLSHLRDSLLPKLMSGKIRVPVEVRT